jgi:hypothetical protein
MHNTFFEFEGRQPPRDEAGKACDISATNFPQRLFNDPLRRFAFVAFVIGSYLRMQKHSDCADQPMLPVMSNDDCDAIDFLLVVFHERSVMLKDRDIVSAIEGGGID